MICMHNIAETKLLLSTWQCRRDGRLAISSRSSSAKPPTRFALALTQIAADRDDEDRSFLHRTNRC